MKNKNMKYTFAFVVTFLFSFGSFAGTLGTNSNQQEGDTTRFITIGASNTVAIFSERGDMQNRINAAYPNETVELYNEGLSGSTITWWQGNYIDEILSKYESSSTKKTYVTIQLGGNDVTRTRPYSSLTQTEIDGLNNGIDDIIEAVEAKGFIPILLEITFRDYDDTTFDNEENGAKPYNDHVLYPKILEHSPEFAFADGQSFMQSYDFIYNNHEIFLALDNIHLQNGLEFYRVKYINDLCGYIFNGTIPEKIAKVGQEEVTEPTVNTPQEDEYYDTYLLPQSEAANLQEALNTHNAVRLAKGDYSAAGDIRMTSNQRLYGDLTESGTLIGGNITIANGSKNVHIENYNGFNRYKIFFESGDPITECTLSSIYFSDLVLNNGKLENNLFRDISRVNTSFNCSESGYFRNNIFIKIFQQSFDDQVEMIGNDDTPSYGNVELSRNILTNRTNSTHYENLDNHKLVGFDAEGWANRDETANAAFYFRDTDNLMMINGSGYSFNGSGEMDIEADELIVMAKGIQSNFAPIIRENTKYLNIYESGNEPVKENNVWEFRGHGNLFGNSITELNDIDLSSTLTGSDAETLSGLVVNPEETPFPKPVFRTLPNPTGDNWATDRIGKRDESADIQALIDANGIAELEDRIYYVGSSLFLENDEGIVGKGTGKTAIVAITDDFPIIYCQDDITANADPNNIYVGQLTDVSYKITGLTLQGGSEGIYIQPIGHETTNLQITNTAWRHVIFRNQNYGVHLDAFYGFDNNFLYNLNFVDCNKGFFQNPVPRPTGATGEWSMMMYVDKTVFYQCQFINCGVGIDMNAQRGNNLDAWVECYFDGNDIAMSASNSNALYFANSTFKNTKGDFVYGGGAPMNFYSCDFTNNSTPTLFDNGVLFAEGCNFNDNMPFNSPRIHAPGQYYLWNNIVNNTLDLSQIGKGFLMNNNITTNTSLNKQMIEVINGNPLVILDEPSDPYPQLLVQQFSSNNDDNNDDIGCQSNCSQEPFTIPFAIPGQIEVEDYDNGGQGVSFNDMEETNHGGEYRTDGVDIQVTTDQGGGYNIGFIRAGEWLEYTVNVTEFGQYDIKSRVASDIGGGSYRLEMDGEIIMTTEVENTGGWQTFVDIDQSNIELEEGEHILRFYAVTGGFNLNWINFSSSTITGIEASALEDNLKLYPNPAEDHINIEGAMGANYELFDNSGIIYQTGNIKSKTEYIDVQNLATGIYFIKVTHNSNSIVEKLILR